MKLLITTIFAVLTIAGNAQMSLTPGKKVFEKTWIKNQTYQMKWFAIRDTSKFEMGTVSTQTLSDNKYLTIITRVNMKNSRAPWVDTTVAEIKTLKPIRHSSFNTQRDMVLTFGKIVTGFYNDKTKQQNTIISDTTTSEYFDSNLYPALIGWLPLKDGYKQDISIYEYNPSGKIGVIKATINDVKSGTYQSSFSGTKNVWIVTVADEIGNGKK
ncbi:MAG: hypothetical protein WKF91_09830 [Segetibacter sp.]